MADLTKLQIEDESGTVLEIKDSTARKEVNDVKTQLTELTEKTINPLSEKLQSFEETKSEIASSGLGSALGLAVSNTWAQIVAKLKEIVNRGAVNASISSSGGSYTIPAGYHNGSGKVTGPTLAGLIGTDVSLESSTKLLDGVTAYGKNGTKYTGSIANKGNYSKWFNPGSASQSISLPAGYYSGGTIGCYAGTASSPLRSFTAQSEAIRMSGSTSSTGHSETMKVTGNALIVCLKAKKDDAVLSIVSGSGTLTQLVDDATPGYGAYGKQANLDVYKMMSGSSATLEYTGSFGNNGSGIVRAVSIPTSTLTVGESMFKYSGATTDQLTSMTFTSSSGLLIIAKAGTNTISFNVKSGVCALSPLLEDTHGGYGSYGAAVNLMIYRYSASAGAILEVTADVGNNGSVIGVYLY